MVTAPLISLKNVSMSFGAQVVLEDVSFEIFPKQYVGFIGPNGGGKTTLLKLILGLCEPTSGEILCLGHRPGLHNRHMGYVPQYVHFDLTFPMRVLDVVLMGRLGYRSFVPRYSRQDRALALQALEEVHLADEWQRPVGALSGGQKQRVFVARALVTEPDILLLDEPTASIDSRVEEDFYRLLRRLSERMSIVLVSHDVGVVAKEVQQVVCVNGRVTVHDAQTITRESLADLYQNPVRCVSHHCHL